MSIKETLLSNTNALDELAGFTGLGWIASIVGYFATIVGYGNTLVIRLAGAQSLLYLAVVFFVTTLGLDRLRETLSNGEA